MIKEPKDMNPTADEEQFDPSASQDAEGVDAQEGVVEDAPELEAEVEEEAELSGDEKLAQELADFKDKYIRLQAEWDNFRKRTNAERAQERSRATEHLVSNLLPVVDDIERAIEHGADSADQGMLEGIKAIHSKFADVLSRQGLETIAPAAGDPFDIDIHQAVARVDNAEAFDESIDQLYQKGYRMGDKLLRPAMVAVTTGGPKRTGE
ncbi:MAG: nucleotide exchange factor GrpE [bacterium]|nr:nucleotide exchange factor GrpE [bacterium]